MLWSVRYGMFCYWWARSKADPWFFVYISFKGACVYPWKESWCLKLFRCDWRKLFDRFNNTCRNECTSEVKASFQIFEVLQYVIIPISNRVPQQLRCVQMTNDVQLEHLSNVRQRCAYACDEYDANAKRKRRRADCLLRTNAAMVRTNDTIDNPIRIKT